MTKITKVVLATLGATVLVCGGGGLIVAKLSVDAHRAMSNEVAAKGDEAVRVVCGRWYLDALLTRSGSEVRSTPKAVLEKKFASAKVEYGYYTSGVGKMTGFRTMQSFNGTSTTYAMYENKAVFDRGRATIRIQLVRVNGDPWIIQGFHIGDLEAVSVD